MLITVGGIKGGPGKTTTASNLAIALARRGYDVMVVDADDQQSLTKWASYREHDDSLLLSATILCGNISQQLLNLKRKFEVVIVDVAGGNTIELQSALKVSDLLICPVEPSQLDLDTITDFLQLIEEVKVFNERLEQAFFMNRCAPLVSLDNQVEVRMVLEELPINLLDTRLYTNAYFGKVIPNGLSVIEVDKAEKAAANFNELLNELLNGALSQLNKVS